MTEDKPDADDTWRIGEAEGSVESIRWTPPTDPVGRALCAAYMNMTLAEFEDYVSKGTKR